MATEESDILTTEQKPGTWGRTKKMDTVHYFRTNRTLCPNTKSKKHGWLFIPRPNWSPDLPGTCPICVQMLQDEKTEEQARAGTDRDKQPVHLGARTRVH